MAALSAVVTPREPAPHVDFEAVPRGRDGSPLAGRQTLRELRSIAEALFATEQGPPPSERLDWLDRELEDFLARCGRPARWTFSGLAFAVNMLTPLLVGRFARLEELDLSQRIAALTATERKLGEPFLPLKALLCILYYEHPDARREIGAP